jgi:hypothetical protein
MGKAATHKQVKAYILPEKHRNARIASEVLGEPINDTIEAAIDDLIARANIKGLAINTEQPVEKLQSMENLRKALGNGEMAKAKERVG